MCWTLASAGMLQCAEVWEEAKPLTMFALEVLSVPATSAPVERVLSKAGLMTRLHRNRAKLPLMNDGLF